MHKAEAWWQLKHFCINYLMITTIPCGNYPFSSLFLNITLRIVNNTSQEYNNSLF